MPLNGEAAMTLSRRLLAEGFGTMWLVLGGCLLPMKKYKNQVEENEQVRIARNEAARLQGTRRDSIPRGAVVSEIEPGSIAEELGIEAGAQLLEINGQPVRDAIQLKMADSAEAVMLTVLQPGGQAEQFDIE